MYNIMIDTGAAKYTVDNLGPQGSQAFVEISGQGCIVFNHIGDKKLGINTQTSGVCITYRDHVWVFRYDGQGELKIEFNSSINSLDMNVVNGTVEELTL